MSPLNTVITLSALCCLAVSVTVFINPFQQRQSHRCAFDALYVPPSSSCTDVGHNPMVLPVCRSLTTANMVVMVNLLLAKSYDVFLVRTILPDCYQGWDATS